MKALSRFDRLLESSQDNLHIKDSFVNRFAYPGLFVISLKELKDLVGNETIKESIASQIMYLISLRDDLEKKDPNSSPVMMNTLLYGPPGTGKTAVASKLAKIWYAMGFLQSKNNFFSSTIDTISHLTSDEVGLYIMYFYCICAMLYEPLLAIKDRYGTKNLILGIVTIFFVCFLIFYIIKLFYARKVNNTVVKDSDVITIVSREDFIDKYVGGTDKKTKALLLANKGKVLFIDEAYSLFNGENDPYGMEALTTLNRFLSENPNSILVIMAGYKNLINENLFSTQPGLRSRFMWHFECNGYNAKELYQIFLVMLKKEKWKIVKRDREDIYQLIKTNIKNFKAHARDIQRLFFFSQLEYSDAYVMNNSLPKKELSFTMIEKAMKVFMDNSMSSEIQEDQKLTSSAKQLQHMKDIFQMMTGQSELLTPMSTDISAKNTLDDIELDDKLLLKRKKDTR